MTPTERTESARRAAEARWEKTGQIGKKVLVAPHNGVIQVGDISIPCSVLEDGTRVLSERGVLHAIGIGRSGYAHNRAKEDAADRGDGGAGLPLFLAPINLKPFISNELSAVLRKPLWYKPVAGQQSSRIHKGMRADLLPKICNVWLKARDAGAIRGPRQAIAVANADILMRGLAEVGIVALVDEATGYQDSRSRDALAKILEEFVAKELRPYVRTFKPDFYKSICDLKGWEFKTSSRRPRALAQITNDLVYARLAPGVLEELQRKNPVIEGGRRKNRHFQWLTEQRGHPELQDHLAKLTGWAEMAYEAGQKYDDFIRYVNKKKPRYNGRTLFDDFQPDDDGDAPTAAS